MACNLIRGQRQGNGHAATCAHTTPSPMTRHALTTTAGVAPRRVCFDFDLCTSCASGDGKEKHQAQFPAAAATHAYASIEV